MLSYNYIDKNTKDDSTVTIESLLCTVFLSYKWLLLLKFLLFLNVFYSHNGC